MQVQINLNEPFEFRYGQRVPKFGFRGDLVIVTDPGKTNMAMVVGTTFGTQLCVLQFRAPGREYDTSSYCHDFKDFISRYFEGCNIVTFGIEQAISKQGMNHHHSSMVLTEIRANLIDLAYSLTGRKPLEINNWSWKFAILPDGMRSQSEKGSIRYLPEVYRAYGNADVTDAVCMYRYVVEKFNYSQAIVPNKSEEALAPSRILIVPKGKSLTLNPRTFHYEPRLSLRENCAYYANRTWELGAATVKVENLTLEDIYSFATGFNQRNSTPEVEVVVVRS